MGGDLGSIFNTPIDFLSVVSVCYLTHNNTVLCSDFIYRYRQIQFTSGSVAFHDLILSKMCEHGEIHHYVELSQKYVPSKIQLYMVSLIKLLKRDDKDGHYQRTSPHCGGGTKVN